MALGAIRGEIGGEMVRVHCTGAIGFVTAETGFRQRALVVAVTTAQWCVGTAQRKGGTVVEAGERPALGEMAVFASRWIAGLPVVRVLGLGTIGLVAIDAS